MKASVAYRNDRTGRPAAITMIFGSVGAYVFKRDDPLGVFTSGTVLFNYPWHDIPSMSREN